MGLGFGLTGNVGFDFFIAQSEQNRNLVMKELAESGDKFINGILYRNKLTRADFTDVDWKYIEQFLGDERDGW